MRHIIFLLLIGVLATGCLLGTGCGGGSSDQAQTPGDAAVVGRWLDIAPDAARAQPDAVGYWHTRCLTLKSDMTFRYEDTSPDDWTSGSYSALQGLLKLSGLQSGGSPRMFSGNALNYTVFNQQLIITDNMPADTVTSQFSRIANTPPAELVNEWLLAMKKTPDGGDLPCLESTRLTITPDGRADLIRAMPNIGLYLHQTGDFYFSFSSHAGLRFAGNDEAPGELYFLGGCAMSGNVLICQTPDSVQRVFTYRTAPDTRLLGVWTLQSSGETGTLTINSDGSYTLARGAGTTTGTWRTYHGSYLCLFNATGQSTYAWHYWGQATSSTLTLGAWTLNNGNPVYQETFWKR